MTGFLHFIVLVIGLGTAVIILIDIAFHLMGISPSADATPIVNSLESSSCEEAITYDDKIAVTEQNQTHRALIEAPDFDQENGKQTSHELQSTINDDGAPLPSTQLASSRLGRELPVDPIEDIPELGFFSISFRIGEATTVGDLIRTFTKKIPIWASGRVGKEIWTLIHGQSIKGIKLVIMTKSSNGSELISREAMAGHNLNTKLSDLAGDIKQQLDDSEERYIYGIITLKKPVFDAEPHTSHIPIQASAPGYEIDLIFPGLVTYERWMGELQAYYRQRAHVARGDGSHRRTPRRGFPVFGKRLMSRVRNRRYQPAQDEAEEEE